jgi:rhodanese-related sulfurtransferase
MNAFSRTSFELLVLGLLGIGLGFGANAVRETGSIKLTKNYFDKGTPRPTASPEGTAAIATAGASLPSAPSVKNVAVKHLQHDYQEITFEGVVGVLNDPLTAQGLNVFVDARKADLFHEGHIPGAIHCDPYEPQRSIETVLARANGVEKVIVYCGGGDCEDSIFLCRDLVEGGVPNETVYLYPGGWSEWTAKKMPVSTASEE